MHSDCFFSLFPLGFWHAALNSHCKCVCARILYTRICYCERMGTIWGGWFISTEFYSCVLWKNTTVLYFVSHEYVNQFPINEFILNVKEFIRENFGTILMLKGGLKF